MKSLAIALIVGLLTLAAISTLRVANPEPVIASPVFDPAEGAHPGLIYGRVETTDGEAFEGRLRWGGDEEATWSHAFNGAREENVWLDRVPTERLPTEPMALELFSVELAAWDAPVNFGRPGRGGTR